MPIKPDDIANILQKYERRDPALHDELRAKIGARLAAAGAGGDAPELELPEPLRGVSLDPQRFAETIVRPNARPVLVIRDNQVTTEFLGPDSQVWADRLAEPMTRANLNRIIPCVGRVEVKNNPDYDWVGTGWLVAPDTIVTNRHVANLFARMAPQGFVFRLGLGGGSQTARLDFLEEDQRAATLEFAVDSIVWIANPTDPDVAFLRLKRTATDRPLPDPIPIAASVVVDEFVAAIGYPARDPRVPDQELVKRIFGDVYDKKRLAPGQITAVRADELEHDCSTLGGNSGSALVDLKTGQAVGLHFSGLFLEANYAVPAKVVGELLARVQSGELPRANNIVVSPAATPVPPVAAPISAAAPQTVTYQLQIPIEITVKVGAPTASHVSSAAPTPALISTGPPSSETLQHALETVQNLLSGQPDVVDIRLGYRFKRGWITDERVVVVELRQKLSVQELQAAGKPLIPPMVSNVGVDVRTAAFADQLEALGLDVSALEAPVKPGVYREPPNLPLNPVKESMHFIFHVSPDCGFPKLKEFFGRIKRHLTATMYEWEPNHISDALVDALDAHKGTLKMVTQKNTSAGGTASAIDDMERRIPGRFEHVWASVGAGKIVPMAYHIKVASRDGEEFWLSSGNWKDSNQPDMNPAADHSHAITPLRQHNREWHAIIRNNQLATLFQKYIEWDFDEAHRVPLEEAVPLPQVQLFVPEEAFFEAPERVAATYFEPFEDERELDVQPLLTPDRNARGDRMFIDFATQMIQSAARTIYVDNQSFSLSEDNGQYEQFFSVLKDKQQAGLDVRIIFRDPREFSRDTTALHKLLELLKDFGFDTDRIKTQRKCHTKGIIVDGEQVILGSENLTRAGSLFNRDASLLVRDAAVAQYFEKIFLFDWETLAHQEADEAVGGMRLAPADEATPPGFRRVSLAELLDASRS